MFNEHFITALCSIPVVYIIRFIACSIPYAKTGFFCDDDEIRYPLKDDTVAGHFMFFLFAIFSVILFLITEWSLIRHLSKKSKRVFKKEGKILHPGIENFFYFSCMIICGDLATSAIVNIGKRTMSRPRPNFLAACQPDLQSLCATDIHRYIEDYTCTRKVSEEQYFSFPSGHSAHSVFLGLFLIMYMQKRCKLMEPIRSLIQLLIASFVFFVCTSRVRDSKHRLSDVGGGALIGAAMGYFFIIHVSNYFKHARYLTTDNIDEEKGYSIIKNDNNYQDFLPKVVVSGSTSDYGSIISNDD